MKFSFFATACIAFAAVTLAASPTEAKPGRIVSIDQGGNEYVLLLAERSRILAITPLGADSELSQAAEMARGIPVTRGTLEEIVMLKPDMVVLGRFTNPTVIALLKKLNIPYFALTPPKGFDDVRKQTRALAQVLGEEARGEEVLRVMDEKLAAVAARDMERKRLIVLYWGGGYTAGEGTMASAILDAAGGENLALKMGLKRNTRLALEDLIMAKPQYILFTSHRRNMSTVGRQVLDHPALRGAVGPERALVIPACLLNSVSPLAVQGVEELAGMLH